jgi:hypothetical protein
MRQPALGKFDWISEDLSGAEPKKPKKKKGKKTKKKKE